MIFELRDSNWMLTRWYRGKHHAPDSLVQPPEKNIALHCPGARILVDLFIVRGLDPGFECVGWVDDEVDKYCRKCAGLGIGSATV